MARTTPALVILGALLSYACLVEAQPYRIYGADAYFTVTSQAGERRGRPVVFGHVVNTFGIAAQRVRLLVESLEAGGQVTATTIGYVHGDVTPGPHVYFEVPVERPAVSYRVSVLSWDWKSGHSRAPAPASRRRG